MSCPNRVPAIGTIRVFDDVAALARGAADLLCERTAASTGIFVVALCGGSTPKPVYQCLAMPAWRDRVPWDRVHWVIGDERFVPVADPESNIGMIRSALLDHVPVPPANIHAIPTEGTTPEQASATHAVALERLRRPDGMLFDINFLGMGDDGHTASLLPGEPVLQVRDRLVAPVPHGRDNVRITLTYPAVNASALVVFLVAGAGKRAMLNTILSGGATVPAAAVRPMGQTVWMVDRAAAGDWAAGT
jgi:6-phosphogluconolactonase